MANNVIETRGTKSTVQGSYALVNGINLYYEIHGASNVGIPLILLHGGFGTIGMFGPLLPALAQTRRIVGVELQAHGHTADIDRPMSYEAMADDVAALVRHLGIEKIDISGYSLGGGVALQMTIRHPALVRKMVLISTPFKQKGWYPDVLAGQAQLNAEAARAMIGSPMQQDYASVAPKPENWPLLADKMGRLLRQDYDWSAGVKTIKAPTLIIIGDSDGVHPAHAVEFFELLGGAKGDPGWDRSRMPNSQLAILPSTTHYDIFFSLQTASIFAAFLDAPMPQPGEGS